MDFWNNLKNRLEDNNYPVLCEAACVRTSRPFSSCRACEIACPEEAITVLGAAPTVNHEQCSGCYHCVAACPESAFTHTLELKPVIVDNSPVLMLACQEAELHRKAKAYFYPCLHAVSYADLEVWHRRGVYDIVTTTSACEQCGIHQARGFSERLHHFNAFLNALDLKPLRHFSIDETHFMKMCDRAVNVSDVQTVTRRHFLRKAVSKADTIVNDTELVNTTIPVAKRFRERVSNETQVGLYTLAMDESQCTLCADCCVVCPHDALYFSGSEGVVTWNIEASSCSGCNACVDICLKDAIAIDHEVSLRDTKIALDVSRCKRCGVEFYAFRDHAEASGLCQICRQKPTGQAQKLFQVYD